MRTINCGSDACKEIAALKAEMPSFLKRPQQETAVTHTEKPAAEEPAKLPVEENPASVKDPSIEELKAAIAHLRKCQTDLTEQTKAKQSEMSGKITALKKALHKKIGDL
jgi:ribosomal protein L29